jgi:MoaA/NifB/PqqE/SkfB family radical SAM enzyme
MTMSIMDRVDAHTHVRKEKFVPRPSFPDAIKIEITSRCNYRCSFCAAKSRLRPQGEMDRDFLYRILREAKSIGVREIGMFLLGESLLVKDLPEYVRYAKETAGIEYVFLTTNGSLATPKRMVPLIEAGLDSIKFSVNAGTRERYREMHGVDAFEQVMKNIRWLHAFKAAGSRTTPRTCVSAIHVEKFHDELESLRTMVAPYVDDFYFLPLYNQGGHVGGKDYTRIVGNPGRLENMVPPIPCWGLFNSAKISWNGWLTSCYFDHDGCFEIADLNRISLLDAWQHPKFVGLREKHLSRDENLLRDSVCGKCLGLQKTAA